MEPIKEIIQNVFRNLEAGDQKNSSDDIGAILKKILAKKAVKHVKLYTFRKGILSIKVDSSTWLYYLNLQKRDLLVKLREQISALKDIHFSLGE